jgi:Flp pilus assembly pilin Flp
MDLMTRLRALACEESGQDLLEYALLVGLIALVAVVAVTAAGQSINGIFGAIAGALAGIPV